MNMVEWNDSGIKIIVSWFHISVILHPHMQFIQISPSIDENQIH